GRPSLILGRRAERNDALHAIGQARFEVAGLCRLPELDRAVFYFVAHVLDEVRDLQRLNAQRAGLGNDGAVIGDARVLVVARFTDFWLAPLHQVLRLNRHLADAFAVLGHFGVDDAAILRNHVADPLAVVFAVIVEIDPACQGEVLWLAGFPSGRKNQIA